jgi:hypothetical protein
MPSLPQLLDHRPRDVFIHEEAHGSVLHVGNKYTFSDLSTSLA